MAQNKVVINQNDGGLGRKLPTEDHVSCILFEHVNKPTFWNGDKVRSFRSVTQLEQSGIVASALFYGIVHYQVSEYFRQYPEGEIYVGFEMLTTGTAIDKANSLKAVTNGRVRQYGVFTDDIADLTDFQAIMDALEALEMDAVCIVGFEDVLNYNAIPNLHARTQQKVHVLMAGDGDASGSEYATSLGEPYLPSVGALLGSLSLAKVHQSIAHVRLFNASDGTELENPIFSDGTLLKDTTQAILDELHDKGWGFLRKHQGVSGSYWDDNRTATSLTSDYSSLNINRVSQKAVRGVRAALIPELNADVEVDATTGNLSVNYIEYLKSLAGTPLFDMQKAGEISGFLVEIDETQNLLSTSTLFVTIKIVAKGISRNIVVDLGFALSL